jgi:hypothetical protein
MEYHGSIQIDVEFTFDVTSRGLPISYSNDGQAIDPPEGPEWEIQGFNVSVENITSSDKAGTMYEEILNMINTHIQENFLYITSE